MLFRKTPVSGHELLADVMYFTISALVSLAAVFLFDVHHYFYPSSRVANPAPIFDSALPYAVGVLAGGVLGLFLFKALFFAFREQEAAAEKAGSAKGKRRRQH